MPCLCDISHTMPLTDIRPLPCARRRMNMFYLIDTSGSMNHNGCIESVN